ncbi:hypothetical protein ElyMa_004641700 [Elysia marginata]|uniref:Uncharacterized protein n=1 Tax=Elysia marginata TaxID=1093978 RepID=A0AAV4I3R0_9GAST|nr:hypothetical protein ElyMa_004641700 [Elysia marginata]
MQNVSLEISFTHLDFTFQESYPQIFRGCVGFTEVTGWFNLSHMRIDVIILRCVKDWHFSLPQLTRPETSNLRNTTDPMQLHPLSVKLIAGNLISCPTAEQHNHHQRSETPSRPLSS